MARSLLCLALLLMASLIVVGCSGAKVLQSEGETPWSGCGLTFTLPPGAWTADVLDADRTIELRNKTDDASLVVVRMAATEEFSPVVAIRRLFAAFDEKTLISESPFTLPDGTQGMRALYDVKAGEANRRVMAAAFRKGTCMYDLAAWGMTEEDFDAVVASLSARK